MSQDAYGNYIVSDLSSGYTPGTSMFSGGLSGVGPPDNSLGNNGNIYVNTTNGDVYTKTGDVWELQVGGGSSISNLLGVVDPGGVVTPDATGQFYTNTAVSPPQIWQAEGVTSNSWRQRT